MTRPGAGHRAATYREVWGNAQFRVLFGSRTLAGLADTLRIVAMSILVYAATKSPALAAIAYGISFLPQLFGVSLLGALTDRIRPRLLISVGYLVEAAAAAAIGSLPLPLWFDLLLIMMVACLTPVFAGASSRVVAEVLVGDAYVVGRSVSDMASSLAQLLGLAGAGIAVAALDGSRALLIAALGHLVASAWVRFGMDDLPAPPRTGATSESTVRRSWTGNLALVRNRPVRVLMLAMWLPPAFLTGADSLLVPYSAERGFPAGTAGWLLAGVPAGMLIGNVVVGRLVSPEARDRLVPALVALMGVPCLIFPAALPWPVIGAAMTVAGFGFTFSLAVQCRFRDAIPPDRQGQAFSLLSTGLMTAQGLCPALAGLVAESVPTADVVAGLGVLTLLTALVLRFTLPGTDRSSGRVDTHKRAAIGT